MILDTSAILAILFKEREAERLVAVVAKADSAAAGAPTLVEAGIILGARLGFDRRTLLLRLVQAFGIDTVPFGQAHWQEAVEAFERFGKGRHVAGLNYGDCLAYAAAKVTRQPLLCIDNDFRHTDLDLVPY